MAAFLPDAKHNILVEFETIVDLDFGAMMYIYKNYDDEEKFHFQLMELEDNQIKGLIHDNPETNPVKILMDIEDYEEADQIYDDIMANHIMEVLELSPPTNLFTFCRTSMETDGLITINILCTRHEYEEVIEDALSGSRNYNIIYHNFVDENDPEQFNVKYYTSLFLRHVENIFRYDNMDGKTVYIQECLTNMALEPYYAGNGTFPNPRVCGLHMENNRIFIFAPYEYNNSYFVNWNYPYDDSDPEEEKEFIEASSEPFDPFDNRVDLTRFIEMGDDGEDEEEEDDEFDPGMFDAQERQIIYENWRDETDG